MGNGLDIQNEFHVQVAGFLLLVFLGVLMAISFLHA